MKKSKIISGYLIVSGLILSLVGALTSFNPVNVKAEEGIDIAGNPSALNDVRGFGFLILAVALFSFIGAFQSRLKRPAIIFSVLFFLSIALGRLFSILFDGMPTQGILNATIVEFVVGTIGVLLLFLSRSTSSKQ